MVACDRCGRATDDGATVTQTAAGPLCAVCVDWYDEHPGATRDVDQQALTAFSKDEDEQP